MKTFLFFLSSIIILSQLSCSGPSGCGDSRAVNYDPAVEVPLNICVYPQLNINFNTKVGADSYETNRIYSINGHNTAFKVFQFYVSQLELTKTNQSLLNYDTLFPLIKNESSTIALGQLYKQTIEKVHFNIGIDSINNSKLPIYINDSQHPLYVQSPDTMHWNSTNGYIFLKLEGRVDRNGDGIPNSNETFNFQIGTNDLLRHFSFTINKAIKNREEIIEFEIDILELLKNVDLQTDQSANATNNFVLAEKIANNISSALSLVQ